MSALTATMREALAELDESGQAEIVERLRRANQIPEHARGTEPPERQPWGPGGGAALERFQRPWEIRWGDPQPDQRPIAKCGEGCGRALRKGERCDCLPPLPSWIAHWIPLSRTFLDDWTMSFTRLANVWSSVSYQFQGILSSPHFHFTPGPISWQFISEPLTEPVEPATDDWYEREARRRDDKGITIGDFTLDLPYVTDRPMLAKPTGLSTRTLECLRQRGALPAPAKPWVERDQRGRA